MNPFVIILLAIPALMYAFCAEMRQASTRARRVTVSSKGVTSQHTDRTPNGWPTGFL